MASDFHFKDLCSDPIRNRHHRKHFRCPACMSRHEHDHNRACSPHDCPEEIPTPRFSGPTRVLPDDEHEKLVECIHQVNDLLLAFADERDPHLLESLRLKFRSMRGKFVRVCFICNDKEETIDGELADAGKDFLTIDNFDNQFFIPYDRICNVKQSTTHPHVHGRHGGELANLDECCRRELILNFGRVVAASPFLINIFFGLRLHLFLLDFIDCKLHVTTTEGEEAHGCLICVDEDVIVLETEKEKIEISIEEICFIKV